MKTIYIGNSYSRTQKVQGKTFRTFVFNEIKITESQYLEYKNIFLNDSEVRFKSTDKFYTHFKN